MSFDQKTRLSKMIRQFGALPEEKEKLAQELAKLDDWYATCRKCGILIRGSLEQVKGHVCGKKG